MTTKTCPCGCGGTVLPGKRFAGRGCGPKLALKGRPKGAKRAASEAPVPTGWWWTRYATPDAPPPGEFFAEAHRRYPAIYESTLGGYTGRKPTSTVAHA